MGRTGAGMGEDGVQRIVQQAVANPVAAAGLVFAIISGATAATTIYLEIKDVGEKVASLTALTNARLRELEDEKVRVRVEIGAIRRDQDWIIKQIEHAPSSAKRGPQ